MIDPKEIKHRRTDVRIGIAGAQVDAFLHFPAPYEQRRVFARVVRTRVAGITPMIRCEDEQIVIPHPRLQFGNLRIKRLQRSGIAPHIAAVAIDHVKIHQVDKEQPVKILFHGCKRSLHAGLPAAWLDRVMP